MHDDLFTKHILDYLQRIIYNRRENVSSKNFSFRMWNTHTSFSEKSYLRYCYINELITEQFVWKKGGKGFWAILAKIF